MKKLYHSKLFFVGIYFILGLLHLHAQSIDSPNFTCDPTVNSTSMPVTIFNGSGGTTDTNGLKIWANGAGNLQINRNGVGQMFSQNSTPSTSPNNSITSNHGWVLGIGTLSSWNQYRSSSFNPSANTSNTIIPTAVYCRNPSTNTYEKEMEFTTSKNGLNYKFHLIYSYTIPNQFFTITYKVIIPTGNTESVRFIQGWDTYLSIPGVTGGDNGPGFITGQSPNYVMGTQKTLNGERIYQAFKYSSGTPWSGYYSATYSDLNSTSGGFFSTKALDFLRYLNIINTTATTDNGIGISIDFGSTPGTYSSVNQVIFKCNAPQTAPTVLTNNAIISCGSPVNLRNLVTNADNLPANVILKAVDNTGLTVSNINAVTKPGVYTLFFEDSDNAGCTSPSVNVTVTEQSCCATSPSLSANTITNSCPIETVNLNSVIQNVLPTGYTIRWYTNISHSGLPIANPQITSTPGTYYAFIYDTLSGCYSISSTPVVFTLTQCCKAGKVAPNLN
jgi:hypothetical protein